jgi:apolipoprotein N-acyltransferase
MKIPANTLVRAVVPAVAGGVLTTLTVPPFGFWPLAIPGIALLHVALMHTSRHRGRFGVGLIWAASLYVPSLWWMTAFSLPGGIIVGLLQATITTLTVMLIVGRTTSPGRVGFGTVSALMIADSLRSLWPFGGLPLGGIDLGQASGIFASIVGLGGRLLLIGVVAAIGVALSVALTKRSARTFGTLAIAIVLPLAAVLGLNAWYDDDVLDRYEHTPFWVTVIQGGGPRGLLASPDNARNTYLAHLEATKKLTQTKSPERPSLILWPENTVDSPTFATSELFEELRKLTGTYLSVGITEDGGPRQFLNAQVMIDPEGNIVDRYDKVRRVPFGEFFPFRAQIEGWGLAELPRREARPGTGPGILKTEQITYGVLISYEGFFDDRARNAVRDGAEVLLIPTNASSYKTSHVPSQQVAAAQLRALETHRDVVQAGPTGYSAHITADGMVRYRGGLGNREVFDAPVSKRTVITPYVRFNDVPALLIAALLLVLARFPRRRPTLETAASLDGEPSLNV